MSLQGVRETITLQGVRETIRISLTAGEEEGRMVHAKEKVAGGLG